MPPAPLLVLGVGNPSRGDDALGPMFVERASEALRGEIASGAVELVTDFQLQIEHALDLEGRTRVVFVDASVSASPPFELSRIEPRRDASCSTHAMSPEAVLETYRGVVGEPPESWVLAIRGQRFELGEALSEEARGHLEAALAFFVAEARRGGPEATFTSGPALASFEALSSASDSGRRIEIDGIVQGVGFRPWIYRTARRLGLRGEVRNTRRGVVIDAFGTPPALDALVRAMQESPPAAARVRSVRVAPVQLPSCIMHGFAIAESEAEGGVAMALPPDLATCDACLHEVEDAADRHHRYAFTSCVDCGPRLSIARALPYDRKTTTMAELVPCAACAAEYGTPEDRRFHAETIACPACGPRVWLENPSGEALPSADAVDAAASLLLDGKVVGVQGIGAFHLVCDATNEDAVAELRRRKRRDAQPFAVMVRDVATAEDVVRLDDELRAALLSPARPIVLAPTRPSSVAPEVSGASRRTGIMLPYTPLHHRLIAKVARPLVVTSGNPSGGPAVIEHAEARAVLGGIADALLFHDRPIARRVEDSVVARSFSGTRVIRRARGFAPVPIRLPAPAKEPVLAVGAHMKNAACLVMGDLAYLTPHLGDLGLVESEVAWRRDVEGFERLLGVRAEVLAHDLHPDYASTRYALARPARRRVGVQHHVAHVLAAIAEVHLDEPALGVVLDGTGFGLDGTSWGAEIFVVDGMHWTRASSFRPLPLAGGEQAIREVWRIALGALIEAFGPGEALELVARLRVFEAVPRASIATVARMIETGVSTSKARGMGRFFDALGALALAIPRAGFDGHVAIALEEAVDASPISDLSAYPIALPGALALDEALGPAHEIDLRPTLRAAVLDVLGGVAPALVSARFHAAIIDAIATVVARSFAATGLRRVVLSGGSFQNRILERELVRRLGVERVVMPREVPVGDGGIALGQAWAAALALAAETA